MVVHLSATSPTAPCPKCGTPGSRVHSRYFRTIADLPCVGQRLVLKLLVRKWVCPASSCAQRIFAERFPELVQSYARMTDRLKEALQSVGVTTNGADGARLFARLSMPTTGKTIIRRVIGLPLPADTSVRVAGIDDWAWKRRLRYGTLICDLERGVPIDLLPERTVETVSAWLKEHPSVDTISRDGSSEYASAIKKGAPQAREVSDRWHLVKNLAGCVSLLLAESFAQLRRAKVAAEAKSPKEEQLSHEPPSHPRTRAERHAQQARTAERKARYEQIIELQKQCKLMRRYPRHRVIV